MFRVSDGFMLAEPLMANRRLFREHEMHNPKKRAALRRFPACVALSLAAALLAACASSAPTPGSSKSTVPVKGGTVTWAEPAGAPPNYIFPFAPLQYFAIGNFQDFIDLIYRPLYWFGNGRNPTLNTSLSLAAPPIYKKGDTEAVINLKPYKWSDGETVTSADIVFWMNMERSDKEGYAGYDPGALPDNVTNVVATGKEQVTFYMNRAYNPTWFTYNELDQIYPMPLAWDVTSTTAKPGSGGCSAATYTSVTIASSTYKPTSATAKACNAVYDFLSEASGYNPHNPSATNASALGTFASSPIWSVVDGPWRLESFNSSGRAVFVPNPKYSGPVKPTISKFVELPFTSDVAEYDALAAGAVDYGYLPPEDVTSPASKPGGSGPNNSTLAANYKISTEPDWAIDYFPYNFNSTGDGGQAGPLTSRRSTGITPIQLTARYRRCRPRGPRRPRPGIHTRMTRQRPRRCSYRTGGR
jgi:peptide/nickel transport system substrate-binding protein